MYICERRSKDVASWMRCSTWPAGDSGTSMMGLAPLFHLRLGSIKPSSLFSMLRSVPTAVSFIISPVSGFFRSAADSDTQST